MLILIGPSASGKTEIVKILIKNYSMEKLVTYTSRPMRVGEIKDKDYHFIEKNDFEERIKNNFFFEHVEYNGNYYGTAKEDLTKNNADIEALNKLVEQLQLSNKELEVNHKNEMDKLRTELQSAQFQLSQLTQTSNIVNQLMPVAKPAYITCSPYAAAFGINSGCGCA